MRGPDRAARMESALRAALSPLEVAVIDESAAHAGHAGASPHGQTHYRLRVVSPMFTGLTRIARSRLVHAILAAEFETGLHAVSLELYAPSEKSLEK